MSILPQLDDVLKPPCLELSDKNTALKCVSVFIATISSQFLLFLFKRSDPSSPCLLCLVKKTSTLGMQRPSWFLSWLS